MSAIASFILLPVSKIEALKQAAVPTKSFWGRSKDNYHDFLAKNGKEVADYNWSGYVLAPLLIYLEEQAKIDLTTSSQKNTAEFLSNARGVTHCIFTNEHKNLYLQKLDTQFSAQSLCDYYNKMNDENETAETIGQAMLDGITCIKQSLSVVDETSITLLLID